MRLDLSLGLPARRHGPGITYDRNASASITLGALTVSGVSDIDIAADSGVTLGALTVSATATIALMHVQSLGALAGITRRKVFTTPGDAEDELLLLLA
jgi:hypothetical protein